GMEPRIPGIPDRTDSRINQGGSLGEGGGRTTGEGTKGEGKVPTEPTSRPGEIRMPPEPGRIIEGKVQGEISTTRGGKPDKNDVTIITPTKGEGLQPTSRGDKPEGAQPTPRGDKPETQPVGRGDKSDATPQSADGKPLPIRDLTGGLQSL